MTWFLLGIAALIAGFLVLNWFAKAPPRSVLKMLGWVTFLSLAGILVLILVTRNIQFVWGLLPVLFVWLGRLRILGQLLGSLNAARRQARQAGASGPGTYSNRMNGMTREEALEILDLPADASRDDIKAAHKRLIKRLHPDGGGSGYLAAKINAAKNFLLDC